METRRLSDLIAEARDYANRRTGTVPGDLVLRLVIELEAVTTERDSAKRGAKTLGEIVERQVEDTLRWAGMGDQIGQDDPDQQTAWELCAEMPGRIASLTAERDEALAALEALTAERDGLRIELSQANAIIAGEFYTIPMNVGDALARTSRIPEHPKED